MAMLRLILGGATATSLRALLLARTQAAPRVQLERLEGGAPVPSTVRRLTETDTALRRALELRGVRVYLVEATGLAPGTAYRLKALVPGSTVHGDVTTLPQRLPAAGLTVAVGSCYYDGYRRDQALRTALSLPRWGQTPAFHIWCGDNLYLDVPADSARNQPIDHTVDRYLRYFLDSGYAQARAVAPAFTTYDDHEFWNNYPEFQIWLSRTWPGAFEGYRDACHAGVSLFQASLNTADQAGLGWFRFELDPLSFFFLDTRSFRARSADRDVRLITQPSRDALARWTERLDGPGVLVLGQPLWIDKGGWTDLNLPHYARDYAHIWRCLRSAPYDVLVVSGDVHHSRVLKIGFAGAAHRNVFEFVSSPACHIPEALSSTQGRGSLRSIPGRVENAGQSLAASYFFGTDAPNTFGLLRFVPFGREVRVGASFVDYHPRERFAATKPIDGLPRATTRPFSACHDLNLFMLRMR
jgi:hypothetical protein